MNKNKVDYKLAGVDISAGNEAVDLIKDRVGSNNFPAYLEGNIWKYLYRHKDKESNIECLQKAQYYLNALIKHYEEL